MKRLSIKQIAWRVVVAILLFGYLAYRATVLFEMKSMWAATLRIIFDFVVCCVMIYNMFIKRWELRSFSYYLAYMKGKDSTMMAMFKYIGMFFGATFGFSCIIYRLEKDVPGTSFLSVLIPISLVVVCVAMVIAITGYIKCCEIKENN